MKRGIAWLLFMCVLALAVPAIAEESFTMAGYDDSGTGHVWETNLFFQRMEEKTGVHFAFQQFTDSETWQQKKAELLSGDEMPDVYLNITADYVREHLNDIMLTTDTHRYIL